VLTPCDSVVKQIKTKVSNLRFRRNLFILHYFFGFIFDDLQGLGPIFFCIFQNHSYICIHKSNIPSVKGCLIFIKKGGEIRLCETLATNPDLSGERCQNLIPESREMIKINTRTMKTFHSIQKHSVLPFVPMCMEW